MTTDIDHHTTTTTLPMSVIEDSRSSCFLPLFVLKHTTLALSILMMTATLIVIPGHRRLRKRHHIFPYNLVLSDLCGAIVFAIFEGTEDLGQVLGKILEVFSLTSFLVSLLSITLVAGYQFITIRVDPFGALNIITTPRLIVICVLTWGISVALSSIIVVTREEDVFIFLLCIALTTTIITGLCYVFMYRSVAMVPCEGNITRERKEENQRVLRTFGLVYGTTVVCWICPWVNWTLISLGFEIKCLYNAGDMMICVNWIANSVIYWWRLKEFRSMLTFCKKCRGIVGIQMSVVADHK